ncbi:reverse transcriptase domain-containing protein [Tanacetum coccineum]
MAAPVRLCGMVEARRWTFAMVSIDTWRYQEGEPRYEIEESSSAQIHPITGEPIHHTIPLPVARLTRHDGQIKGIRNHQREISVARSESDERIETLEQEVETLRGRAEDSEARLQQCQTNMRELKAHIRRLEDRFIIAQRVASEIETIAIYETKTRVARDSRNQVKCQEYKVTENASNKRKWEGDHGRSSSQQRNKGHKVIGAHVFGPSNKKCSGCKRVGHLTRDCMVSARATSQRPPVAKQKTKVTCYECGILGHYKSICPKWKSQNHVNKSNVMSYNINA